MKEDILLSPTKLLKVLVDNSQPTDEELHAVGAVRRLVFELLPSTIQEPLKKSLLLIGLMDSSIDYLYNDNNTSPLPEISNIARIFIPHPGSTWNSGKPYIHFVLFILDENKSIIRSIDRDVDIDKIGIAEELFANYIDSKISRFEADIDKHMIKIGELDKSIEVLRHRSKEIIKDIQHD